MLAIVNILISQVMRVYSNSMGVLASKPLTLRLLTIVYILTSQDMGVEASNPITLRFLTIVYILASQDMGVCHNLY